MKPHNHCRSHLICATFIFFAAALVLPFGCKKKGSEAASSGAAGPSVAGAPAQSMRAEGVPFFTDFDKMLPDRTFFYLCARNLSTLRSSLKDTLAYQTLQSPEVRQAFNEALSQSVSSKEERDALFQMLEKVGAHLNKDIAIAMWYEIGPDGVTTIQYAILHQDPQSSEQLGKDLHETFFASLEQQSRGWERPVHRQTTSHEGVTIYSLTNGQFALSYAYTSDRLVISGNPDAVDRLVKGQPVSGQSLMQNFKYQQYLNSLNADTYISVFFDTEAYYNDLAERLHFSLLGDAERTLVEFLNLNRTNSLTLSMGLESGQFASRSSLKFKGQRTGFYKFFGGNRDFETLRLAPENSRMVFIASLQPLAEFYDNLLAFLQGILDPAEQQSVGMLLAMAEAGSGLSIRNDLLANIGAEVAFVSLPSSKGGISTDPVLLLKINDTAKMDGVLGKVIGAQQGPMAVKSDDLSFQGQTYHHLHQETGTGVYLGYLRNFLIATPSEQAYQAIIAASSSGKSVMSTSAYQQFAANFPSQHVVLIYSLTSSAELSAYLQMTASAFAAGPSMAQNSPDPNQIQRLQNTFATLAAKQPTEFFPSIYAMVETSEGLETYGRSKFFYTPDILTITGLGTTLGTPLVVGAMIKTKALRVQREMTAIRSGMARFLSDRGSYPANLQDLTGPQVRYIQELKPDPFAAGGNSPYSYTKDDSTRKWAVLSPGPNGTFDITQEDLNFSNPGYYLGLISKTYDPTNGVFSSGDIVVFQP